MQLKKKVKLPESKEPMAPAWMLTLGDTISLLLTFFVLLISFSSLNDDQLMSVMGVVQGALGAVKVERVVPDAQVDDEVSAVLPMGAPVKADQEHRLDPQEKSPVKIDRVELQKQFAVYEHELRTMGSPVSLTLQDVEDGLVVRIEADRLFDAGHRLLASAEAALGKVASLAVNVGNEIRLVDCSRIDADRGDAEAWATRLVRTREVAEVLATAYGIQRSRFGYGVKTVPPDAVPAFELVLMDPVGARDVSIQDLWARGSGGTR